MPRPLPQVDYLDHLRTDGPALAGAARRAPDARVPSCPGWDMAALVGHTGRVHRWVREIVGTGATEYLPRSSHDPPSDVVAWYEEGLAWLIETLVGANPDAEVWNWFDRRPAPARFWYRRMAQETVIHRWDAEAAAAGVVGGPPAGGPVPAALAVDGIDEFLSFGTARLSRQPVAGLVGSLHLHATDTTGEWFVELSPDHLEVRREHAKAGAALRGSASDLYLWLLNRKPADPVGGIEVFGDRAIVEACDQITF